MKTHIFQKALCSLAMLFFSHTAFAQYGTLTGVITSCYTGAPVLASITINGAYNITTLANGSYSFTWPAGPVTLVASASGYLPTTYYATVISNQTVTANACLNPVPATITGVVTNCATGVPIVGAKILFGTISTYSAAGGVYTIQLYPGGIGSLTVQKDGFDNYMIPAFSTTPPNIYTVNINLRPSVLPQLNVSALLNTTQDTVHLSWLDGFTDREFIYDDGYSEGCIVQAPGNKWAFKFTSCSDFYFDSFRFNYCGTGLSPLEVAVYDDNGPGGTPGTVLVPSFNITPTSYGWLQINFPSNSTLFTQGNYFLVITPVTSSGGISIDTTANQHRSYTSNGIGPIVELNGNLMIRITLSGQCPEIPPVTTTVYRLLWGQENTPSLWTTVGITSPGSLNYDDGTWGNLPCGPYRYALRQNHPCGGNTNPAFSNVLGKCWTANVNVHAERCCPELGNSGILVKFQNLDHPDSIYIVFTNVTGNAIVNNMWKGNYSVFISSFGCSAFILAPIVIMNDTTINCTMGGGPVAPPTGLSITLMEATWNAPALSCIEGYNVYINSALNGFTADTFYQIPPIPALAGQNAQICVETVFGYNLPLVSTQICDSFQVVYLIPPANFTADTSGCSVTLTWMKPLTSGGLQPSGLLGYNIYRDDNFLHFCPSPDSLSYTEDNLNGGVYTYNSTAFYELSSYGGPGLYGESLKASAADTVSLLCGQSIPFTEGWDFGTFSFTGWTFEPSQGNWNISNSVGQPIPAAAFTGGGKGKTSGYEHSLITSELSASNWICSDIHLHFDLKLEDILAGSTEKLIVEVNSDGVWNSVGEFTNHGSFGWETEDFLLQDTEGKEFFLRFRAVGYNLSAFHQWSIDNINVYGICPTPQEIQAIAEPQVVELAWQSPCAESTGYNIWRTDAEGNPPFVKINENVVTTTSYADNPNPWTIGNNYKYFVTSVQEISGCESAASDTVSASFPVGLTQKTEPELKIFPNPARDFVDVIYTGTISSITIMTSEGMIISQEKINAEKGRINVRNYSSGLYFLKIEGKESAMVRKLVILSN